MTKIFLTSGATWTVPSDWNNASNSIEIVGAGGLGFAASSSGAGAGGGGAYSKILNAVLTHGSTIDISIAAGGSEADTFLKDNSSTIIVSAKAGKNGDGAHHAGAGGLASGGVGTTKYDGGNGAVNSGSSDGGAGGGAAAGPNGAGGNGSASPDAATGGAGGQANNGAGVAGGAGGAPGNHNGANGGNGTEFDATHGCGSGAGGGGQQFFVGNGSGGNGGQYGGGGGSAGKAAFGGGSTSNSTGGDALIVITYDPITTFPVAFTTFRTQENVPGNDYDDTKTTRIYAEDFNLLRAAVSRIEQTLGLNVEGSADTVSDRIAALE
jgi:hypothetical protein